MKRPVAIMAALLILLSGVVAFNFFKLQTFMFDRPMPVVIVSPSPSLSPPGASVAPSPATSVVVRPAQAPRQVSSERPTAPRGAPGRATPRETPTGNPGPTPANPRPTPSPVRSPVCLLPVCPTPP